MKTNELTGLALDWAVYEVLFPDDGQLIHPTEEGIKNFWRWFGDSKVVDKNGRPLVVYHGTEADFTAFDFSKAQDGAHWFVADEGHAASFGNPKDYYVSIKNPMQITQDDLDAAWDSEHPDGEQDDRNLLPRDFVHRFVADAKAAGHDGLIIKQMGDRDIQADMYLPFTPTQIKSATGNDGTFSPTKEGCTAPPYSSDWAFGGPIIEREIQSLIKARIDANTVEWEASDWNDVQGYGPTPLIAAMRCYVASKLGDEVEIPEELK